MAIQQTDNERAYTLHFPNHNMRELSTEEAKAVSGGVMCRDGTQSDNTTWDNCNAHGGISKGHNII
jgi:hypothetical protein